MLKYCYQLNILATFVDKLRKFQLGLDLEAISASERQIPYYRETTIYHFPKKLSKDVLKILTQKVSDTGFKTRWLQ